MAKYLFLFVVLQLSLIAGCEESTFQHAADRRCQEFLKKVTRTDDMVFEFYVCRHTHPIKVEGHFENGELILKGRIKRALKECCDVVVGHIDFAIFSDDGYLIKALSVKYRPVNIPKVGKKSSGFKTRVSGVPTNPVIKYVYHDTTTYLFSGSDHQMLDCGDNRVLHAIEVNNGDDLN